MKFFEILILFLCFVGISFLLSFYFMEYKDFRAGFQNLKNGNLTEAHDEFSKVLLKNELDFSARLNLSFIETLQGRREEALEGYEFVSQFSKSKKQRFYSYFNSGFIEGDPNLDEALDFYQKALGEDETSLEVKTNIELLMKQEFQNQKDSSEDSENSEDFGEPQETQSSKLPPEEGSSQEDRLSPEQIENILKDIENSEQKLKLKMNPLPEEEKGKPW